MSGDAALGSFSSHSVSHSDYLETFCLSANSKEKDLRFTIHITRSVEPIQWKEHDPSFWEITIIPNNGESFRTEKVFTDEPHGKGSFTFPAAPSRPGYSFAGWGLNDSVFNPDDTVEIYFNQTVVAVWDRI